MFSIYVNNTPDSNKIINSTSNSVRIYLNPSIELDTQKKWQLRVLSGNIVYCEPNITSSNNKFSYIADGVTYDKTIPTGTYSLDDLNNTIARITTAQNGSQLFAFVGNEATSTVIVYFAQPNTYINLSSDSIMSLLGFGTAIPRIGGFLTKTGSVESTQKATLDNLQLILVKCNITNGSYLNGGQNNIICGIPINANPYSQLQHEFIHPSRNGIFVDRIDNLEISLLSQNGENLDFTNGGQYEAEGWNLVISIEPIDMPVL